MTDAVLDIHVQEHRTRWSSPQPIEDLLAILDTAPWGPLAEMSVDLRSSWVGFDRGEAVTEVWHHTGVNLRWAPGVEASIAHNPVNNTVGLYLPRAAVAAATLDAVVALIDRLAGALPAFAWAKAVPDAGAVADGLCRVTRPPPPFVPHGWLHVLHRRACTALMIDRAALLDAPVEVDERTDGTIWLRTYADPFATDPRDAIPRCRAFARHLERRARPYVPSPAPRSHA